MSGARRPVHRELDRQEIDAILSRNHVGRIAFTFHDRVDIEPIHYVFDDGWIYGRTSTGTKLDTVRHNYWVAFEVDEIEDLFHWRSVVVRGGFYLVPSEGPDAGVWERAVELLRRIVPDAFTESDPLPELSHVFRIAAQEVTGRASSLSD